LRSHIAAHRKTRQPPAMYSMNRRNNTLCMRSCLRQLRMTFPSIIFHQEFYIEFRLFKLKSVSIFVKLKIGQSVDMLLEAHQSFEQPIVVDVLPIHRPAQFDQMHRVD